MTFLALNTCKSTPFSKYNCKTFMWILSSQAIHSITVKKKLPPRAINSKASCWICRLSVSLMRAIVLQSRHLVWTKKLFVCEVYFSAPLLSSTLPVNMYFHNTSISWNRCEHTACLTLCSYKTQLYTMQCNTRRTCNNINTHTYVCVYIYTYVCTHIWDSAECHFV